MKTSPESLEILADPDRVAALLHPERRRLVDALRKRPDSASGLARRLGDTRQRLNYHLGILEDAGLLELAEERPRRGVPERVLRPVAPRFVVDSSVLGSLGPEDPTGADRLSASYLVALAARAIRELADWMAQAAASGKRLPTAGLSGRVRLGRPADFDDFVDDLSGAVADVIQRHHVEEGAGRDFRVVAGSYPAPDRGAESNASDDEEDR